MPDMMSFLNPTLGSVSLSKLKSINMINPSLDLSGPNNHFRLHSVLTHAFLKWFKLSKLNFFYLLSTYVDIDIRHGFGVLFIAISLAILFAAISSYFLASNHIRYDHYPLLWFGSFSISIGISLFKERKVFSSIRTRMKKSLAWSPYTKIINGLCWAAPFSVIPIFHNLYPYLILLGIGMGNISTYLFMKRYSKANNKEQLIVGLIAICGIPISIILDSTIFSTDYEIAILFSRLLITASYGVGGIYSLVAK
jgi:hypothetical protein